MRTLFFGSIGTLAETSQLQLEAFNAAFAQAGLEWHWTQDEYKWMLAAAGGAQRIADFATSNRVSVDVEALHRAKSEIYRDLLQTRELEPRTGVLEAMNTIKTHGGRLALVTSTSLANVTTLLDAIKIPHDAFDLIVHCDMVEHPKPSPDAYLFALKALKAVPSNVLVLEDNPDGALAAIRSGVTCLAVPGEFHANSVFPDGIELQSSLNLTSYLRSADQAAA